ALQLASVDQLDLVSLRAWRDLAMKNTGYIFCAIVALSLTEPLRADWPHMRGSNYDGVSAEQGLADSWPLDGPPRLWTRDLGQGHSGFIVADGRIFTQYQ